MSGHIPCPVYGTLSSRSHIECNRAVEAGKLKFVYTVDHNRGPLRAAAEAALEPGICDRFPMALSICGIAMMRDAQVEYEPSLWKVYTQIGRSKKHGCPDTLRTAGSRFLTCRGPCGRLGITAQTQFCHAVEHFQPCKAELRLRVESSRPRRTAGSPEPIPQIAVCLRSKYRWPSLVPSLAWLLLVGISRPSRLGMRS